MTDSDFVPKLKKSSNNIEINGNIYSPKEVLENRKNNASSPYAPILLNKDSENISIDTKLSPNSSEQNSPNIKTLKNSHYFTIFAELLRDNYSLNSSSKIDLIISAPFFFSCKKRKLAFQKKRTYNHLLRKWN